MGTFPQDEQEVRLQNERAISVQDHVDRRQFQQPEVAPFHMGSNGKVNGPRNPLMPPDRRSRHAQLPIDEFMREVRLRKLAEFS